MLSRLRPRALLAAAVAVAAAVDGVGTIGGAASASAAAVPGACTNSTGVTVIVDFTNAPNGQGRGLEAGCAQHPANGVTALTAAGFSVAVVQQFPAAVCQIDGLPDTSCVRMPPASAYWSYWSSADHRTWTYQGYGAGNRTPPPGTVDGWSFSTGTSPVPPGISPAALAPAPTTSTATSTTATAHTLPKAAAPTTSPAPAAGGPAPGSTAGPTSSGTTDPAAGSPTVAGSPSSTPGVSSGKSGAGAAVAAPEVKPRASVRLAHEANGSGSPWPVVGGVGGAAVLAAGAFVVAHRRRASEAALDQPDPE